MTQLELFDGLQPVKKWLHVWTDAERERNKVVHAVKRPSSHGTSCADKPNQRQAGELRK